MIGNESETMKNVKDILTKNRKITGYGMIAMLISLVLTIAYYHLWGTDLRVPLAGYRGDSIGLLLDVNNYVRGGNIHNNAIFGAPDVGGYRNVMADYAMMFPTLRLFWKISGSVEAAVNIQAVFNNVILSLGMYIVCIRLKLNEKVAVVLSILLANTSFLILGYNAIMMTYVYCFYLPLFVYYVIKMMLPEESHDAGKEKFSTVIFLMLFMFLTGVNSLYYAFFCLILLAFVCLYTLFGTRSVKNTLLVILSVLSIGYGIAVCILPNILYGMGLGTIWDSGMYYVLTTTGGLILTGLVYVFYRKVYPKMTMKRLVFALLGLGAVLGVGLLLVAKFTDYMGQYDGRTLYAVELGALNIVNLTLPSANNVFAGLDRMVAVLTDIDNPQACDSTEMGVLTGIGLIYSMLHIFQFHEKDDDRNRILEICGKCNCFLILLSVKGGLASVIATYITTGIRNYNRTSILIMIFSLISFGIFVERLMEKIHDTFTKGKRVVLTGLVSFAVLVGIVVSIPTHYIYRHNYGLVHYDQRKAEYDAWQELITDIESSVENGTMILELPNPVDDVHKGELMTEGRAYELSIPAIVSKSTIWSYGSGVIPEQDLVTETEEYIVAAKELGFGGIYLDTMMYADNTYKQCIDALNEYLGEPDASDGQRRYFWKFE